MPPSDDYPILADAAFRLGEWTVEPELGRMSRGNHVVSLRPRAMAVLVSLAGLEGRLASKQHLIDTVWETEFVSDNALTHVIAELRTELGDDTENPTYIETIPRRGYRLIAPVTMLDSTTGEHRSVGETGPIEVTADAAPGARPKARARWVLAGSAVIAVVAVAISLLVSVGQTPKTTETDPEFEPVRIAVETFENHVDDPALDDLGSHVADSITALLRQVGRLTVVVSPVRPAARVGDRRRDGADPDATRRFAEATRPDLIVAGACYSRGVQLEIQARIIDPRRDEARQIFAPVRAPLSDPSSAVDTLSGQMAGTLARHVDHMIPLGLSRPVPLEAYREFTGSLDMWGTEMSESISRLERALEIDPAFVLARARLIALYSAIGMVREAEAELEAFEAHLPTLTPIERSAFLTARAQVEGRPAEALRCIREAVSLAPDSYWLLRELGKLAIAVNRPREAVDALSRIPYDWPTGGTAFASTAHYYRCFALHMLGDYEKQLRVAAESHRHFPDRMVFFGLQGNALAAMGRFDEADGILEESRTLSVRGSSSWGFSHTFSARELRAHGDRERSLQLAGRCVEWYRKHPNQKFWTPFGPAWGYAATLHAAERWREALEVAEQPECVPPYEVQCRGLVGVLEARIGNEEAAERIAAELRAHGDRRSLAERCYWRACIASQLGQHDEAMRLLQRAFSEGLAFSDEVHRDINLEPLWDLPQFRELIEPKG